MGVVVYTIERADREIVDGLKELSTPTVCEAMGERLCMTSEIKPLYKGARIAGTAITCLCPLMDNLMLHKALQVAKEGDVIVVNHNGYVEAAPWGEMMSRAAKKKGLEGIVIDGMARDALAIEQIKFPVFARGTAIWGTSKKFPGFVNQAIQCGGVYVNPGDIVLGDENGVVVVPKEKAKVVLQRAREREKRERQLARRIAAGELTDFMFNYQKKYDALVKAGEITEIRKT